MVFSATKINQRFTQSNERGPHNLYKAVYLAHRTSGITNPDDSKNQGRSLQGGAPGSIAFSSMAISGS